MMCVADELTPKAQKAKNVNPKLPAPSPTRFWPKKAGTSLLKMEICVSARPRTPTSDLLVLVLK